MPVTITLSPFISKSAPREDIADIVASISFDMLMPLITDTPSAKAAHIIARCAQLFDAGILSFPLSTDGLSFIIIINSSIQCQNKKSC